MMISLPYGRTRLTADLPDERISGVLTSRPEQYVPPMSETALVEAALNNPIGSKSLEELTKGKENIVLIASDHIRPVPSKILVPPMLSAICRGNPHAKITILIATGKAPGKPSLPSSAMWSSMPGIKWRVPLPATAKQTPHWSEP